jgi:HEAT repeat protein
MTEPEIRASAKFELKPADTLQDLLSRFGDYCGALFEELAATAPEELAILMLADELRPAKLSLAAEILGRAAPEIAEGPLLALLSHDSPLVREGVIYGLSRRLSGVTRRQLVGMLGDPSASVREAAADVLEAQGRSNAGMISR